MLTLAPDYDSMYREGLDGFIGVKSVPDEYEDSGKRLEMVTLIDTDGCRGQLRFARRLSA